MVSSDIYTIIQALLSIIGSALAVLIAYPSIKDAVGAANSDFIRIAISAFAGSSSAGIVFLYFRNKIQTMPLFFRRGHVIICGLNHHTLLIIRDLVKSKIQPVIIDSNPENMYLESCHALGLITLIGQPSDPTMLKKAAVNRANHVLSLGDVDENNAEVALTVIQMVPEKRYPPLTCTIQMINPLLYGIIRKNAFAARKDTPVRIEFFNQYALGARMLLDQYPPALPQCPASDPPAVIIVGAGMLGTSLAVRISRTWYQAHKKDGLRFHLTILDVKAEQIKKGLLYQYPLILKACELDALPIEIRSADFKNGEFLDNSLFGKSFTAYICLDDDSLGLYAALTLHHHTAAQDNRFIIRMDHNTSVAKLISDEHVGLDSVHNILPVNMFELTATSTLILAGEEEILARAIHENYCSRERLKGHKKESNWLLVSWDELGTLTVGKDGIEGEKYRESNRQQANFIWTNLARVGCSIGPITDWDAPDTFQFRPDEIAILARFEHDRWMNEKLRDGWRYGAVRDDAKKLHPALIPFDQLPEPEKEKDRDTIRQIPELLSYIDFQVNRE